MLFCVMYVVFAKFMRMTDGTPTYPVVLLLGISRRELREGLGIFLTQAVDVRLIVLQVTLVALHDARVAVRVLGADRALAVVPVDDDELLQFVTETVGIGLRSIVDRGDLLRKVHFPNYIVVVSASVGSLISLGINYLVVLVFALFMRMNFANTTYMTQNSINGLSTDHATPRNEPW